MKLHRQRQDWQAARQRTSWRGRRGRSRRSIPQGLDQTGGGEKHQEPNVYDFIVVGAGAAGCVMAYRLSDDPATRVLLIECGPPDTHPMISMPKGFAKVLLSPAHVWVYNVPPRPGSDDPAEPWLRGRTMGGSTSVNGMVYSRGQPADFDHLAALSSSDWGWDKIAAAYKEMESHQFGATNSRGDRGPFNVTVANPRDRLSKLLIAAGMSMGQPFKADMNEPDNSESVGPVAQAIHRGRRVSAATAFIDPIRGRRNLTVVTDTIVDRVVFEAKRAVGVIGSKAGAPLEYRASKEVIICGGAMSSPLILQRSGIGDGAFLATLNIPVVYDNSSVGQNLAEHRPYMLQFEITQNISQNPQYRGARLLWNAVRYYLTGKGPLALPAFEVVGFAKTSAELDRPNMQYFASPFSYEFNPDDFGWRTRRRPGMGLLVMPLRPRARGSIAISSRDPLASPAISFDFRSDEEDLQELISSVRFARRFVMQEPLRGLIDHEIAPGEQVQTDEEILEAAKSQSQAGYHAVGTCRMGNDAESVVDPELRVRGVEGLRVVDTSIMPEILSSNTMAPTMVLAWRGADIILAQRQVIDPR